ncbi:alkylglycerol monooxygenase-like [Uloborus diversus]|uniref:alkylglycerol monooxygenase-like n=1 Tax=Uloborus diversus TaxID=327109 RepID=UPI00240A032E|nr:alkylglycerol monooxygenase-like [Uloborus diversus]
MEIIKEQVKRFGWLFYVMDPREHTYEKIEDVKDYYAEVTPLFFITIFLEQLIRYYQKKPLFRVNDTISNVTHGVLMQLSKIPFKGAEVFVYAWIYKNYRLIELDWDSPWTWILCWFATDFGYYWMHRMIHQVNILWAIHETHHTPEDMHFTAPMRNHIFLLPIHWLTYLPMALAIPPTTYLVHYQISIIYQYWLHSEIIYKLPAPLEYILSTPSHHRGHHGRNRRYIDKNFGGFLIIWDRIFGTFEEENEDDKPLYGLTKQMKSFNPLIIQTQHFHTIWKKFWEYEKIGDKLSVVFKGPGWAPGKPWTGNLEDIPEPAPYWEKYDPQMPTWCKIYVLLHFVFFVHSYMSFVMFMSLLSKTAITAIASFLSFTCITFGFLLDNSRYGPPFELLRCMIFFLVDRIIFLEMSRFGLAPVIHLLANRVLFSASIVMWCSLFVYDSLRIVVKEKSL